MDIFWLNVFFTVPLSFLIHRAGEPGLLLGTPVQLKGGKKEMAAKKYWAGSVCAGLRSSPVGREMGSAAGARPPGNAATGKQRMVISLDIRYLYM